MRSARRWPSRWCSPRAPVVTFNLISNTNPATIAANIALELRRGDRPDKLNVLIATGLVLFVITFAVNFAARAIVARSERKFDR